VNAPHNALFSPDGLYIAISYRGANPAVWFLGGDEPRIIAHFDHRTRRNTAPLYEHTRTLYVQSFAWNPLTGHLLGTFYGGMVFKWHPQEGDSMLASNRGESIKCSADGKLFITGAFDGTLRIWDFEHFTPIYQLRYPLRIQDLDLGRNQARVYDLRERYCNIWEPTSLLRALESDDVASDSQSRTESEQPSIAAESVREQEDFEPITAFSVASRAMVYAIGDDSGKIAISDFDGEPMAEISDAYMSIEQLLWCGDASTLASVDLGRDITIRRFEPTSNGEPSYSKSSVLQCFSEPEEIQQLQFNDSGEVLMVVTPTALKVQQLPEDSKTVVVPTVRLSKWAPHPHDRNLVLGFSANQVILMPWADPLHAVTFAYEEAAGEARAFDRTTTRTLRLPNPRRPSEAYPTSPSEIDQTVHKVCISSSGSLIMVEIFGTTKQARRRSACLLMETAFSAESDDSTSVVSVCSIPSRLTEALHTSLGFVDPDHLVMPARKGSFAEHRRTQSRRQRDLSTFVFVDKDFWVCSADIGMVQDEEVEIRKHFFLPGDWRNAEWLELATVTPSGHVLCPRNGTVATVSNGLTEEFGGAG
ncbi:hypothetical protein LTR35_015866, partial [Friedmanniomyces endolithicus]